MDNIIIKQADLDRIMFQDVRFKVKKSTTIDGEKYSYEYEIVWNGALGTTALEQASMHQAKNEYNNTRPSTDTDIMSPSECARRQDAFIKLAESGKPKEVLAVAERAKVRKHSAKEIVDNLFRKDLKADEKAYWQSQYDRMQAEADAITAELNRLNIKS